jgi:bifunctional DNA-binding transcriptional regulator/antitoxin component of YhaV-PrlF toxin-antitoxin module
MGYQVKIQKVDRGQTKSYYINFPAALAEASGIEKGEEMEWELEDKNTFILKRVKKSPPRKPSVSKDKKA